MTTAINKGCFEEAGITVNLVEFAGGPTVKTLEDLKILEERAPTEPCCGTIGSRPASKT